ncbi:ATP-binding protein [Leptospira jelokensis]|uniref:ATP-binding protein n=1 Tax=Leptospira jelokensis TaxID=2484931 RepID=UPI00109128B1|nr:AAA family ATPase [Leptospira jelokensis]TGM05463.1 DNA repair protein [Leptospira jelokensis]
MKLKLENFGIFTSKEFPIQRITVFTGPNESGKTTILDAFVSALVKVTGTKKYGKLLNERYQENRNSDLGIEKQSLSPNLFLNSLVIREGNMEVGSDSELTSVIEQSIFDSGFNPGYLKEQAEIQVTKNGNRKVVKDWNLALSELDAAKRKFDESERNLNQISKQFAELPSLELERQNKKTEIESFVTERNTLQKQFEELKEKELHADADRVYHQILQWEMLSQEKKTDSKFLQNDSEKQIKSLEESIRAGKQKIETTKERLGELENGKTASNSNRSSLENKFQKLESYFQFFESWKDVLRKFQDDFPVVPKVTWNPFYRSLAVVSIFLTLFTVITILFSDFGNWMYMLVGLFLGLSLFFGIKMKETKLEKDEAKWNEMIRRITSEMETKTLGEWKPDSLHLDSLFTTFQRYEREYTKQKLELQNLVVMISKMESEIQNQENLLKKEKDVLDEKEKERSTHLQNLGVSSLSELSETLVQIRLKADKIKTIEDSLGVEIKKWETDGIESLKLKLKDKMSDWEKQGIGKQFQPEDRTTKQRLENRIRELTELIRSLEVKIVDLEKKLDTGKAILESQMVPAQKEWESNKKNLESKEKKKIELEKNFQAFEVLVGIFSEMQKESTDKMSSLVRSLQNRMDAIKGTMPSKQIHWNGFSDEIQITSNQNEGQFSFGQLSTGTREQISFVLRLEYAFRIGNQFNVPYLLLDEPFRHMDNVRRNVALEYTLQCIANSDENWKVVFFSFDEDLVANIQGLAEKYNLPCQIHMLSKQVS